MAKPLVKSTVDQKTIIIITAGFKIATTCRSGLRRRNKRNAPKPQRKSLLLRQPFTHNANHQFSASCKATPKTVGKTISFFRQFIPRPLTLAKNDDFERRMV